MAVPAAPAAGAGALLGISLLALLAALLLLGFLKAYEATLGAMLQALAEKIRGVRWVGGKIAGALDSIDDTVKDSIATAALSFEKDAARLFHGAAVLWQSTVDSLRDLADATATAISGLVSGEIPQQITERTRTIHTEIARAKTYVVNRDRVIAQQASHGIDRLQRELGAEALARQRGIDALETNLENRLDGAIDAARAATRGARQWAAQRTGALQAEIGTVLGIVGAGALTAAAVRALDTRFPWYKCSNVKRFNKRLCGSPIGALDDLLDLALLTVGSLSIVEFAELLQGEVEYVADAVNDWIVEN